MKDISKERQESVSGSANVVYKDDVLVTGERYTSSAFMELEMEKLWPRVWNIGAWANEIPETGDYVTHQLGRESILMVIVELLIKLLEENYRLARVMHIINFLLITPKTKLDHLIFLKVLN